MPYLNCGITINNNCRETDYAEICDYDEFGPKSHPPTVQGHHAVHIDDRFPSHTYVDVIQFIHHRCS